MRAEGGVPKTPVDTARLGVGGVEGDKQNDLRHHGGPLRAVCIYSLELIEALQTEGHPIGPGTTGDNLTISGLDWDSLRVGDGMQVGGALIRLNATAPPCNTIVESFARGEIGRILEENHPGWSRWYASVIEEASVSAGDSVNIVIISDY
ncbi:MAG: MOSC domain-containing protein [Candidatus Thalassarchaeaceae archaeon]|nr:MOSC domain-containing protein [Candidatus Thalassarchaeaceae archaeon]MDP6703246.1 MOSC domain-containing protein [Candidatus Thalassarchaeaceae archaeon]MDP7004017.1 MOSC domain-containing protein [Candidatus Thalassarchaeaceae archaeon]